MRRERQAQEGWDCVASRQICEEADRMSRFWGRAEALALPSESDRPGRLAIAVAFAPFPAVPSSQAESVIKEDG
jgi:hypothetical protein